LGGTGLELNSENLPQAIENKELTESNDDAPIPPRVQDWVHNIEKHPELEQIIKSWPDLPEHIRQAIMALAGTQ
jgi:hypothetical protein